MLSKPHDAHDNNKDPLEQRQDRVGDRRRQAERGECKPVLRKVHGAIQKQVDDQLGCRHGIFSIGDWLLLIKEQAVAFVVHPQWHHQEERDGG